MTRLSARALGRAALTRQFLLERAADVPVHDAVAHLGGLQAQEPREPFVGLWTRLRAFDPAVLSGLLTQRRVVRTHLMRRTVHLVTAEPALAWRARHDVMLRQRILGVYRRELDGVDLDELAAAGRDILADGQPRSLGQIGRILAERWPAPGPRALGEAAVAAAVPVVQIPPRGLWRSTAGAGYVLLAVLVDGRVAATWTVETDTVNVTPLRRFTRADRSAVAQEGQQLASFLSDGESHRVRIAASQR